MLGFSLHPNVYSTGSAPGLIRMLEQAWVRDQPSGLGSYYIVSGFGNYNGGVRFYETFRTHVQDGGKIVAFFGGSTSQNLTSRQVVEELLGLGAEVHVINRKRILHAKLYGTSTSAGERLVVTSGNFTGPGMGQNVESAVILDSATTNSMGFSWQKLVDGILSQSWNRFQLSLGDRTTPGWKLLYDEFAGDVQIDESEEATLLLVLGHADTARIQAPRNPTTSEERNAGKWTQYFWLSKDCYGFFPPLTVRNKRGTKATFSCLITLHYMDLKLTARNTRVTFEAENNLDFRLGTGQLRYTKVASDGDLAAITRVGEDAYEVRILPKGSPAYAALEPYAINFIGHQGKRYGFIDNDQFAAAVGRKVPDREVATFDLVDANPAGAADE